MTKLAETITERRRQTRNSIYQYMFFSDTPHSKQEIASDLSLSMPTVHQNLTELIEAGLVRRDGTQQSTGGRRAMRLTIAENAHFAIGISVTETGLRFLAANLRMQEIAYKRTQGLPINEIDDLGRLLADELEKFLDEFGLNRNKLLGVGIAIPAVINVERNEIALAPTLHLKDISLDKITKYLPYSYYISNDATSGGYAEWFTQTAQSCMAYLFLEIGVGGAVLLNGAPYEGQNRRSGEFGHMCVEPNGLPCKCGKRGCLEAYCSTARISDNLGITLEDFFEGLELQNPVYGALWQDVLQHLAIGINNIRMALDCDVVLGGYLTQFIEPYLPEIRRLAAALNTFENKADYIRLCRYPMRASMLGVALHFIREFMENI
ncbi:Sugar kinase of the NBD/HSP70 family, may contain an N-terminal HTH domain [Sporobacter termitidis DSM 10068]|uniref:Sugar kinase of the NBD/HSP70 family, may contain an N-terminal HTH domain n=1 Tax=Sporobacter termitidis DSM 10068 TaxID=1123282 RepID=A0A1M5ZFP6_9FIRM|nr:ROK family transcriptional regulator [Sporobacter termitidis]SHI22984.1 Sugar kinase of the NBD/HSP70 family, may contain an N-terminal HTH domain [Sporobacter termitidis DSM 10068]